VAAIETVYPDFRDLDGLTAYAARAARDGFTGMLAIHPAQVPVINAAFTPPFEMVRSLALFAAHAAGVPAIETVYPDFRDLAGLEAYAARAARDGFTGMLAIHPAQVPVINAAFTPGAAQIAEAEAVVAAFATSPRAGVVSLDGRMLDAPHLKQAQTLLRRARAAGRD
jgi:citrate lyase subunit beta/citryl-CoA lyase